MTVASHQANGKPGWQGKPPIQGQGPVTTWSKLLLFVIMMTFIVTATVSGFILSRYLSVLGIFLIGRMLLQYLFANLNNRRMRTASGRAMVDGIFDKYPELTTTQVRRLNQLVGKKLTLEEFMRGVEETLGFSVDDPDLWKSVAYHSIKVLNGVLNPDGSKKYNVNRVVHVNVPIYHMKWKDMLEVLEALSAQLMTPAVVWLVPNGDDLPGENIRKNLKIFVRKEQQKAQRDFDLGRIGQTTLDMLLNKWQIIELPEGDKRSAMLTAWLATFGVAIEDLGAFVKQLFDHPEIKYTLGEASAEISLNVDSDTIAHFMASFITYLTFVQFDISGLTSNVRISNISDKFDPTLPWHKAFEKWFMSWSNYFKYDFANNVERAAQSWFWCVVVMSGPWMAIRTSTIPGFMARFVNYRLNGVRIKPGDDRKVTYELNMRRELVKRGWFARIMLGNSRRLRTAYHPWVVCYTDAPDNVPRYCDIQDRWTQSSYANFFTSIKELQILLLHPWCIMDQLYAAGFTFLVMGVFGHLAVQCLTIAVSSGLQAVGPVLFPYLTIFAAVNLFRGAYAVWDNKDPRGMLNAFYFILVIRYLIPIKIDRLFFKGVAGAGPWKGR